MRTVEITLPPTEVARPIMKLSDLKDRADAVEQVLRRNEGEIAVVFAAPRESPIRRGQWPSVDALVTRSRTTTASFNRQSWPTKLFVFQLAVYALQETGPLVMTSSDSTVGSEPTLPRPFIPVQAKARRIRVLRRELESGHDGLPARITSSFSPTNTRIMILASRPAPLQQPRAKPGFVLALPLACRLFILTLTALLAGMAVPAVAQNAPAPTNLLPNPSFEQKIEIGVQGWKSRAWSGETAAHWTIESPGRTGTQCLSIGSDPGSDAAWSATVAVRSNTFYRLSGWIKTKDVRGAVGALLNIQNLQHVRTARVAGTKDWTQVSTIFRTGTTTNLEINCLFGGWGESTGQAWFDDVALEPLANPPDEAPQATITLHPNAPSVPCSPMIFGGFIEHFDGQIYGGIFEPGSPLSDARGYRQDVIAAFKELRLSIVRWPGGCFASGYHWKDGVGRPRKPVPDPVWGVVDPNTFGTDEFVEWCRQVGCEPYICSNAGNGTPEEMRDWVEYCNATSGPLARLRANSGNAKPWNVRYWSIGNENWGDHEIGARTPQEWGPLVARSAQLMLTADPSLVLLAAATAERDWTLPLLNAAGKYLQYVAVHGYWLPCWGENLTPEYLACIMKSEEPENTISRVIEVLDEAGCRGRVKIAFDEWNLRGWHHPGFPRKAASDPHDEAVNQLIRAREKNHIASQYSMADALFSASFLNACLRHAEDVGMANIAPIVNTRGPLFVHPKGLVKRTTFHTLALYANHLENRVSKIEVDAGMLIHGEELIPVVDAVATVDKTGKTWAIALVNRHPSKEVDCTVKMENVPLQGTHAAIVLSGDSPEAYNDVEHPNRVAPKRTRITFNQGVARLAPHSLTLVKKVIK